MFTPSQSEVSEIILGSIFFADAIASAQDRSLFCILNIMNEISQHHELMDTFLVGNLCHIFLGRLSNEMQSTFHKALTNTIKKLF